MLIALTLDPTGGDAGGDAAALSDAYLLAAPLMMFAEGFFTGALVTGAVVYAPEQLETWDDATLPGAR